VAGENLRQAKDWLPIGKQLVTMKIDCDLSAHIVGFPELHGIVMQAPDEAGLTDFYQQYGFKGLVSSRGNAGGTAKAASVSGTDSGVVEVGVLFEAPPPAVSSEVQYDCVLDWASFDAWLKKIEDADLVALDTETTSLVEMQAQIVGISVCIQSGEAAYIPLGHNAADAPAQLPLLEVLVRLKPWLENPSKHKLGQHVKYDRHVFANQGIQVQGYVHDTMLQSYVLEVHKPHSLASLAERHLGRQGLSYEDLCGKGAHQISFSQVDVAKAVQYACEDADFTLAVHQRLWPLLQADDKLGFIYQLEMDSSEALYRIERNGVLIDAPTLATQSHALGLRMCQARVQRMQVAVEVREQGVLHTKVWDAAASCSIDWGGAAQ
jgi:DNA polymerase-1